jgi:hypothetical protein
MKTRIKPCIPPSIITILRSALLRSFCRRLATSRNRARESPAFVPGKARSNCA